jgi:hypothetical protein
MIKKQARMARELKSCGIMRKRQRPYIGTLNDRTTVREASSGLAASARANQDYPAFRSMPSTVPHGGRYDHFLSARLFGHVKWFMKRQSRYSHGWGAGVGRQKDDSLPGCTNSSCLGVHPSFLQELQQISVDSILKRRCDAVRRARIVDFLCALDESSRFSCRVFHWNNLVVLTVDH